MQYRLVVAIPVLIIAGLLLIPSASADDATDWYMKGENAVVEGRFTDAIEYYNTAIMLDPNYSSAYSGKAYAFGKAGNYTASLSAADKALSIRQDTRALNARALALFRLQRYGDSIAAYDALFTVQTNLPEPYCNQGTAYENLNETEKAIVAYDACARLDPTNYKPSFYKGRIFLKTGKPQQALDAFDKCTRITITDAEVWNAKGEAYLELGRYQDALDSFRTAVSLDPSFTKAADNQKLAYNKGQSFGQKSTTLVTTSPPPIVTATPTQTLIPQATESPLVITFTPTTTLDSQSIPVKTTYAALPVWSALAGVVFTAFCVLARRK
jgi:tetratricopeptide (TPR) repeat protein